LEAAGLGHEESLVVVLDALSFNNDGLIPAIAQDATTGAVLMLAWMNRTAIERSLAEGYACYYSRSRQALWKKGETSGHLQALRSMRFDCDGDAILLTVEQTGPACHTNRTNCFYLEVQADQVAVISTPQA
jgi:phosphoribosyl-AMP cyclohydrolase